MPKIILQKKISEKMQPIYCQCFMNIVKNKLNNNFKPKEISLGDEIITINSNLCNLSYDHFSKSYSKGVKLFLYFN